MGIINLDLRSFLRVFSCYFFVVRTFYLPKLKARKSESDRKEVGRGTNNFFHVSTIQSISQSATLNIRELRLCAGGVHMLRNP